VNTRAIKHAYDKRPAQEYDFLIQHLHQVIKYPDKIYKNKRGKRGSYCFIKQIKNELCFCSIEVLSKDGESEVCEVVTFFTTDESYLISYELLWEWKDGIPSS
jgi:hypothetical protein